MLTKAIETGIILLIMDIKKLLLCIFSKTYKLWCIEGILEMSSSWNFPARASPSCEDSEPSRAELGHFNFRAETELTKILGPN